MKTGDMISALYGLSKVEGRAMNHQERELIRKAAAKIRELQTKTELPFTDPPPDSVTRAEVTEDFWDDFWPVE